MTELHIKYRDGAGEITERRISDILIEGKNSIDAYCHLREERRSFKVGNILLAVNPETGEVVENVWRHLGLSLSDDGREHLDAIMAPILPAIKALKFFSMQIRGFAKRERMHIIRFIQEQVDATDYSEEEVDQWLYALWCGDLYRYREGDEAEYLSLLEEIPRTVMSRCRDYAVAIARCSGRKPIPAEIADRIDSEFSG